MILLVVVLSGTAWAQRCPGFVSVDGALLEDGAACYFGDAEGAQHAYIRTDLLTAALGLESDYLPETSTLRFQKGAVRVDLTATDDVTAALAERAEALVVDGQARPGRSAILAGSSYLPLAETVRAFGGNVEWNDAARLVVVDFSEVSTQTEPPEPAVTQTPPEPEPGAQPQVSRTELGAPRYGVHETYTRVAVDVPAGVPYRFAVDRGNFIVLFGAARADPYEVTPEGAQLSSLGYTEVAGGAALALIASTRYPLAASGQGFSVGRLRGENGGVTLYIDFAPGEKGKPVERLTELPTTDLAAVQRPGDVRKTVVIDPGHGGHDPGAVSDFVTEEDLVLSVGLMLKEKLLARGIGVEMTRDDDTFVELEDRAKFAVPSEHNLFVSLHANSTETAGAEGIETWIFGEPQDDSLIDVAVLENGGGDIGLERTVQALEDAASIDGDLLREENLGYSTVLAKTVQHDLIGLTGSEDRGVKKNSFIVIGDARVPAVLVELGFVNHPEEGPRLSDMHYQERLAEALADGVEAFLTQGGSLAALGAPNN